MLELRIDYQKNKMQCFLLFSSHPKFLNHENKMISFCLGFKKIFIFLSKMFIIFWATSKKQSVIILFILLLSYFLLEFKNKLLFIILLMVIHYTWIILYFVIIHRVSLTNIKILTFKPFKDRRHLILLLYGQKYLYL